MWNNYLPNSITLHDIAFWVDGFQPPDRKDGTAYTFTDTSQGVKIFAGQAITFDGVSAQVTVGDTKKDIKTIVAWVSPTTADEALVDLDGSISVTIVANQVTATGWTSPSIYTNNLEDTTIADDTWTLVTVTSDTGITADAVEIGLVGASFMEGSMTQIIGFTKVLTAVEIGQIFNNGRIPGISTFLGKEDGFAILQESGDFIIV